MPWSGLGSFNLVYNWVTDRNNGIKILASRMMTQEQDIADGLENCMTIDGQTLPIASINLNSQKITLLAAATLRTDAINMGQYQDGSAGYSSATGTNTYTGVLDPAITAYPDGMMVRVYFPNANTAAATASLDLGGGARNLVVGTGTLAPAGVIKQGVGLVVAKGTTWQYFPSAGPGPFGMIDGGFLGTGASAEVNTAYMIDCTGTVRTVNLPSSPSNGDLIPLTIFGTNNCLLYASGKAIYGNTATIETGGIEGLAMPRYTGTSRGWVW